MSDLLSNNDDGRNHNASGGIVTGFVDNWKSCAQSIDWFRMRLTVL